MKSKRRHKALSLVELMITVSIFTFIGGFLGYISIEVARKMKQSINEIPSLEQNFRTLNFIRTQLLPADWKTLSVAQDGSSITFLNPAIGTTASLTFNAFENNLLYDPDVSVANDERQWSRGITGEFIKGSDARTVQVNINSTFLDKRNNPITYNFSEEMKVRN